MVRLRKTPLDFLFLVIPLLLAGFWFGLLDLNDAALLSVSPLAASLLFLLLIVLSFLCLRFQPGACLVARVASLPGHVPLLLLLAAVFVPRLLYCFAVHPAFLSDYELYILRAREFADTGRFNLEPYFIAVAPNVPFIAAALSLPMRLFGSSDLSVRLFILLLHGGNVFLLYAAGKKLMSPARALGAALVFAFLPENTFYSAMPGVEAPALFTMLLGWLALLSIPGKSLKHQLFLAVAAGLLLMLSAAFRASAWALILPLIFWLLRRNRSRSGKAFLLLLAMVLGMLIVFFGLQSFRSRIFAEEKPTGGLGWSLYEGLDLESGGRWTPEKSLHCVEVIEQHSAAEADRIFREEALERFRSYSFSEKLHLFLRKGGALWYDAAYSAIGVQAYETERKLIKAARHALFSLLAFWIAVMLFRFRRPLPRESRPACALCLTVLLLTSAWHALGTSIGRYHYMMLPFVLLLIALLLPQNTGKKPQTP